MKLRSPDDYAVVMYPFPGDILACVQVDPDGYPTIFINDYLSRPAKQKALDHELRHIMNGDFHNHYTIYDAERQAAGESRLDRMMRSFTRLSADEEIKADLAGIQLFAQTFGPRPCETPLPMPDPMFDREPGPRINVQDLRW